MRQLLRDAYKFGHEQRLHEAEAEYWKYRTRLAAAPSDVELAYLETLEHLQRKFRTRIVPEFNASVN